MATIIIDKDNALDSVQKILKLVSAWKRLEVKVESQKSKVLPKIDVQKSYKKALKEYENGEFTTLLTVK